MSSRLALTVLAVWIQSTAVFGQAIGQHGVFKASLTLPVQRVDTSGATDKVVTKSLGTNDVINLFLGRALGTKVDPDVDGVLALDVTFEESAGANPPKSRLVLYDPLVGGKAGVKQVVGTLSEIRFLTAYAGASTKGIGLGKGTFNPTPPGNGDPSKNAILSGELTMSGGGAGPHIFDKQANSATASSATGIGPFHFRFTDKTGAIIDWDGLVLKGTAKVTGKQIGNYVDP